MSAAEGPVVRALAAHEADSAIGEAIVALWDRCALTRPWNDARADLSLALKGPASAVLVAEAGDVLVGATLVGHDGHRGALYYLAVDPSHRAKGLGRTLVEAAEAWLRAAGISKLNVMIRDDNAGARRFYEVIGFAADPVSVMSHRLVAPRR